VFCLLAIVLTLDDAVKLAMQQASTYQQAVIEEQAAALDVTQARAALLPKARSLSTVTFNRNNAFIAANGAHEYQELAGVEGSLDFGTRAAVARSRALLAAAHAGTEVARRELVRGVREAYFGFALVTAKRSAAEESLKAAEEFDRVTTLQQGGGEVPEVDVIRARLQTAQRRDDVEAARTQEAIAIAALHALTGIVDELSIAPPEPVNDLDRYTTVRAPLLAQTSALEEAARADVQVARAERLPSLTYSIDEGFDTPSLREIREHTGYLISASLRIPLFDWGAARAKQKQAELHAQSARLQSSITRRDLERELVSSRAEAAAAMRRVENARAAIADARRNVDISIDRYRAGEATIVEVTDAMTTLAQLRAGEQQALFDFQVARARLQEAAGE